MEDGRRPGEGADRDTCRCPAPECPVHRDGWCLARAAALTGGYRAATGNTPPSADDLETPLRNVLLYAAAGAMVAAIVNTTVTRQVTKASARAEADRDLTAMA